MVTDRMVRPLGGVYRDFRAIMHVHAEDADHTLGTREQVLNAARETGVKVVLWTDHRGPKPDTWRGIREGVLFIPGSEDDHELRFPHPDGDLRFLSHIEEIPAEKSSEGYHGMEIYNRHTDATLRRDFAEYFKGALAGAGEFRKLPPSSRTTRTRCSPPAPDTSRLFSNATTVKSRTAVSPPSQRTTPIVIRSFATSFSIPTRSRSATSVRTSSRVS
jgi:hypothetical protein